MQTHTDKLVQLFLKVMMDMWVDVPADVELAYKKKKYEESVLREKFDDKDPEEVCTQPFCERARTHTHTNCRQRRQQQKGQYSALHLWTSPALTPMPPSLRRPIRMWPSTRRMMVRCTTRRKTISPCESKCTRGRCVVSASVLRFSPERPPAWIPHSKITTYHVLRAQKLIRSIDAPRPSSDTLPSFCAR
jgi:hypothetical protein